MADEDPDDGGYENALDFLPDSHGDTCELLVRVVRQDRPKAIQVILKDIRLILWLPRSCVEHGETYRAGDRDIWIDVQAWLVEKTRRDRERAQYDQAFYEELQRRLDRKPKPKPVFDPMTTFLGGK